MRTYGIAALRRANRAWFVAILVACVVLGPNATRATNRPFRTRRDLVLTVGHSEGDLRGADDKVIQAGIDYLNRLGGGTLRLGPGVYHLRNAIHLRAHVTLRGAGERTVLRKARSVETPLVRDSDWFEYAVQVENAEGFIPGGGLMLRKKTGPGQWQYEVLRATITAIREDVLYLDRSTQENFWIENEATATTIFPLLTAEAVDDITITDLVLNGNRNENHHINGNFAGAVFIQNCNRWRFENVTARNYNGDGFSFQVCDDIEFVNCQTLNNADLGFHPGSGSQRPVFRNCQSRGNAEGIFFCWSVSDGRVENCTLAENRRYGISIGHRDTDNIITGCTIERNGRVGILFRRDKQEFRGGHRNRIEHCTLRDNGTDATGIGIDIRGSTHDITVRQTRFENATTTSQHTGIRIGPDAQRIVLEDNTFDNCPVPVQDLRPAKARSR